MSTDSETLFKQARLEMKAAGAWYEAALSAHRLGMSCSKQNDIPGVKRAAEEGLYALEMANYHRELGEALLDQRDQILQKGRRHV